MIQFTIMALLVAVIILILVSLKYKGESNPFKMAGSYIGLLFGFVGSYFSLAIILWLAEEGNFTASALLIPLLPPVVGFILGWKVHSLIKVLLKKKRS